MRSPPRSQSVFDSVALDHPLVSGTVRLRPTEGQWLHIGDISGIGKTYQV